MSRAPALRRGTLLAVPPLLVAALVALLLVLAAGGGGGQAVADTNATHRHDGPSPAALDLRRDMRALWEDHVIWTRMAIVDFAAGSPSLDASMARLLRNQVDIGDAIVPFYGRAAGTRLTGLLREHILIAVDVLGAAKAGDQAALIAAQARWARNGTRIADFLSSANPRVWRRAPMRAMMQAHLILTTEEAVARLTDDWKADVRNFDRVHGQALHMADMLSAGIVRQFPRRFR